MCEECDTQNLAPIDGCECGCNNPKEDEDE
jgi:hypothetical protein